MKRYRYKWTKAYAIDAQVAGEILQKCKDDQEVLDLAVAPDHPLHAVFDWDDSSAARAHRLHQARTMRCSLQVEIVSTDRKVSHVSAFIRTVDRVGYVPTLEATVDELTGAEMQCWREMKKFRERFKSLQFARAICDAIADKEKSMNRTRGAKRRKSG